MALNYSQLASQSLKILSLKATVVILIIIILIIDTKADPQKKSIGGGAKSMHHNNQSSLFIVLRGAKNYQMKRKGENECKPKRFEC